MSARRYALILALALLAAFVAINVIVSRLTPGARLDLTSSQLYSVSKGTRETLKGLAETVDLTLYYSREAGESVPQVRAYAARVRELLQSYVGMSNGMVRLREVDPLRFTEAEDRAVEMGLQPFNPGGASDPIYFGLVGANAVDERIAIPFFAPQREPFLEYEITRLISELEQPRRLKVAIVSSLPLSPDIARDPRMSQQAPQPYWQQELARLSDVEILQPGFAAVPEDAAVIAVIQPWALTDGEQRAIDQFIMAKGRAILALDPASIVSQAAGAPPLPPTVAALDPLLASWGVAVSRDVVLDREGALYLGPDQPPQPLFLDIAADRMNRTDLVSTALTRGMSLVAAGVITNAPVAGVTVTPLAKTTANTMRLPANQAQMLPPGQALLAAWAPTGRRETVAVRISGALQSAFAGAPLSKTKGNAEIILIADADFLDDRLYIDSREGPQRDNGAFLLNAIDQLSGSDALISLRSRAPSLRRLTEVDKMRVGAQARVAEAQQRLREELATTEQRLAALQNKGAGSGFFQGNLGAELSGAERGEIERFRARIVEVRGQLREVERSFRVDLDRLQGLLMLVNVWLAPILVIAAGVFVSWRRRRRARPAAKAEAQAT
jgi:ABC-2 type transport system permease protein